MGIGLMQKLQGFRSASNLLFAVLAVATGVVVLPWLYGYLKDLRGFNVGDDNAETDYQKDASRLFYAMQHIGTDEAEIFDVVRPYKGNRAKQKSLEAAFGSPKYSGFGAGWFGEKLPLLGWLRAELSSSTFDEVKTFLDKL